jgi:hypothetical protein
MWSQMSVHIVVVIMFVTNLRPAVDILICVVSVFHYTVRIIILMIRLVIRTGNLLFSGIVLAAYIWRPTGSGLPVGSKVSTKINTPLVTISTLKHRHRNNWHYK